MGRRVLVVPTGGLRREGITSSILSFMRSMDFDGLDVRVAAVYNNEPDVLDELRSLGCEVVETPDRRSETLGYARFLLSYMRRERIDVAHVHGSSSVMAIELRCAQLAGVRERIAHSHNTMSDDARRDKMLRPVFRGSWTRALACGDLTGAAGGSTTPAARTPAGGSSRTSPSRSSTTGSPWVGTPSTPPGARRPATGSGSGTRRPSASSATSTTLRTRRSSSTCSGC